MCAYARPLSAEHKADGRRRDGQRNQDHDYREQSHKAVSYLSHRPSRPLVLKLSLEGELCNVHADARAHLASALETLVSFGSLTN